MLFASYIWIKNDLTSNLGQVFHLLLLHLETEQSETPELQFANNQEGLPASLGLSTIATPWRKLRDFL